VDEVHVEKGAVNMLVYLTPSFRGVFEELPSRESKVMTILAEHGPIGTFTSKLIQLYEMGTPALHKALSNLMLKDLVFRGKDRKYFILDPFLTEWIRMVSKDEGQFSHLRS
jgi:hypothetical protein